MYCRKFLLIILIILGHSFLPGQTFNQLWVDNERLKSPIQFKDDDETLKIKLEHIKEINQTRKQFGLQPVELDMFASRVANMHCVDMVKYNYAGHWDSIGSKPYQRYALNGGIDHVSENVYMLQAYRTIAHREYLYTQDPAKIPEYLSKGFEAFMSEKPPNDGHRKEILNPNHTHVGLGYANGTTGFRYCEEFIDRYLELNTFDKSIFAGQRITFTGKVLDSNFGIYGAAIYYDSPLSPYPNLAHQPNRYPDYGEKWFKNITPWETRFNFSTQEFSIPVSFDNAKTGLYYVILYVKSSPQSIPYNATGRVEWNTAYGIPATSIVIDVR